MWQQWVNGILGLWVVAMSFVEMSPTTFTWTAVVTGLAIAVLGFWGASEHTEMMHHEHEARTA